jgi:hypothetical protein
MAPSVVEPNFLAEPRHLATLVEAVRYLRKVMRTDPLAEFIGDEMLPGASVRKEEREIASDVKWTVKPTIIRSAHARSARMMIHASHPDTFGNHCEQHGSCHGNLRAGLFERYRVPSLASICADVVRRVDLALRCVRRKSSWFSLTTIFWAPQFRQNSYK